MNPSAIPTEEILEALDLSRAQPGTGFLEALFSRFNARVLFENASEIIRNAEIPDPAEKPRWPPVFWKDFLKHGAGGVGFARVAAFDALLKELGFSIRKLLGRVERDFDHAALLVSQEGRGRWLCDVSLPLPQPLLAETGVVEAPLGELSCAVTPQGYRIELISGVPENQRSIQISDREISDEEFTDRWKATLSRQSRPPNLSLLRQETSRVISFSAGEVHVDDRHSRLSVPFAPPRGGRLAGIFEIDRELLEQALLLVGDPPAEGERSRLTVYFETGGSAEEAFAAIGSGEGYRRFLQGVAVVVAGEQTSCGWRFQLAPPGISQTASEALLVEEAIPDSARRVIRIHRPGWGLESEFRVEELRGRTYLVREALFDSAREDLLRNDSLRGRLAGALAVDLVAWSRLLSGQVPTPKAHRGDGSP